jgi:hypothetical protein
MATMNCVSALPPSDRSPTLGRCLLEKALVSMFVAVLSACGGGEGRPLEAAAIADGRAKPLATTAVVAESRPVITTTGVVGYGTGLRPDGGILSWFDPTSFPMNNAGTVAINSIISDYGAPTEPPRRGFSLTSDGISYSFVPIAGQGQMVQFGHAFNDAAALTMLARGIEPGTPEKYRFFNSKAPYAATTDYSEVFAFYGFNLHTNAAGIGVGLVRSTDFNVARVLRFLGDGRTEQLEIAPEYLSDAPLSKTRILDDGTIYVGLLNVANQNYEIWRFAAGETLNHSVAYAKASTLGAILAWDVNESGTLAVAEWGDGAGSSSLINAVATGGSPAAVPGSQVISPASYSGVFINRHGVIAGVRTGVPTPELLYAKPGEALTRVLGVGDPMFDRSIVSAAVTSEINDAGQLTMFMGLSGLPGDTSAKSTVVRVNPYWAPSIAGLAPASGPTGTSVTISGADFNGATAVRFNGVSANFTVVSPSQVVATVPSGATTGLVTVTGPAGSGTSAAAFTVVSLPALTGFTPLSGPIGTVVRLNGSNLTGATGVTFNGIAAAFTVVSDMQINTTVPVTATGPIAVSTAAGTVVAPGNFTVTANPLAPTIQSFAPASGGVGTAVTLRGTNLNIAGSMSVRFNGTLASWRIKGMGQVVAVVPAGASSGPITITTNYGMATSADFTVLPSPAIAAFSPGSGTAGTVVSIFGSAFDDATSLAFNGAKASFTVLSPTQISAIVPKGAKTGLVSVSTPGGIATSASPFAVVR